MLRVDQVIELDRNIPMTAAIPEIERNHEAIAMLCRKYGVAKLELFGSAVVGPFDPENSDFDFIVEYRGDADLGAWLSNFLALREDLKNVLGRSVDLVMAGARKNSRFWQEVDKSRVVIYE